MTQTDQSVFFMDPDGVRHHLAAIEALMADLQQATSVYQQALAEAAAGDPHGYLTSGLEHGYNAVHGGQRVVAMLDEILRNAHTTVNDFEAHDRTVHLTASAPPLATIHAIEPAPATALTGQIAQHPSGRPPIALRATILPGGPMFDAAGNLIRFNLTVAEFDMLTADERIYWALAMERLVGKDPWFHNIIDIITFFSESSTLKNLTPGSWMSYADAAVLEALQNGYVLHLGGVPVSMSGGAAVKWQDFINYIKTHNTAFDAKRMKAKSLWAIAEQHSINYGLAEADTHVGRPLLGADEGDLTRNFIAAGNLYRLIARIPGGGGMLGRVITERIGRVAGTGADAVLESPLMPDPVRNTYVLIEMLIGADPLKAPMGEVTQWMFGNQGYEIGEQITDPRMTWGLHGMSNILFKPLGPAIDHPTGTWGPTYLFAKVVETSTLVGGGALPLPPDYHIAPDGTLTFVNNSVLFADGTLVTTDGTRIFPDGRIRDGSGAWLPTLDDAIIRDDGSLELPNGYITDPIF